MQTRLNMRLNRKSLKLSSAPSCKVYQAAGAAGGMPGGMPGGMNMPGGGMPGGDMPTGG